MLCGDLNGKEIQKKRGDIRPGIHITDSLCCTVEMNTSLLQTLRTRRIQRKRAAGKDCQRGREDGARVRRGDHLPSHRYIRNTSTRGTSPTEHPLKAGRRRQTSQKARNSPRTWVGQKKKEITETKE